VETPSLYERHLSTIDGLIRCILDRVFMSIAGNTVTDVLSNGSHWDWVGSQPPFSRAVVRVPFSRNQGSSSKFGGSR
jgi:hypothetical protein